MAESLVSAVQAAFDSTQKILNAYLSLIGDLPTFIYQHPAVEPPPNRLLQDCVLLSDRLDIIKHMPKEGKVVEVGTQTGLFAKEILEISEPKELHVIDQDYKLFRFDILQPYIESGNLILHKGDSSTLLSQFDNSYFDYIYIDADHSYEGFMKDLLQAEQKVAPEGYIICSDYTYWSPVEGIPYGIVKGINEFSSSKNWKFEFFALQKYGYHNIALKRT